MPNPVLDAIGVDFWNALVTGNMPISEKTTLRLVPDGTYKWDELETRDIIQIVTWGKTLAGRLIDKRHLGYSEKTDTVYIWESEK